MPDGGRLELVGRLEGEQVVLTVADSGVGMDQRTLEQLFTPFFTTKSDGTGLGLVSCRRIVEGLGGQISVHSVPGEGTRFDVRLPVPSEPAEDEFGMAPAVPGQGERILIVFRDGTRLSLLGNALGSQGYVTELASDGAAALRSFAEAGEPDVLVVDDSIALFPATALLSTMYEAGYRGPTILVGDAEKFDRSVVPEGVVLEVLPQPLDMHRLFAAVAGVLARRNAR